MSFGSTILVFVWLAVGVSGLLVGLVWLRSVESRANRIAAVGTVGRISPLARPEAGARNSVIDRPEPDSLAG